MWQWKLGTHKSHSLQQKHCVKRMGDKCFLLQRDYYYYFVKKEEEAPGLQNPPMPMVHMWIMVQLARLWTRPATKRPDQKPIRGAQKPLLPLAAYRKYPPIFLGHDLVRTSEPYSSSSSSHHHSLFAPIVVVWQTEKFMQGENPL